MGNASSTFTDEWSLMNNPAGLSWGNGTFVNLSYLNHHFITPLDEKLLGMGFRRNNRAFGLSLKQQGDYRFKKSDYSVLYSQLFANIFSLGISLNYRRLAFSDIYGSKNILYASFGFLTKMKKGNYLSFYIINPSREFIDKNYNERLETFIISGYSHPFSSIFSINVEIEKGLRSKFNFKLGFRYDVKSSISILMGYEMAYQRFSNGLSITFNKLIVDLSVSYENTLGFRTGIGISYALSKNK